MASIRSSATGATSTRSKPMMRRPERASTTSSHTASLKVRPPETGVPVWGQFSTGQSVDVEADVDLPGKRRDDLPAEGVPRLTAEPGLGKRKVVERGDTLRCGSQRCLPSLKSRTPTWAIRTTCGTSRRTLYMIEACENSNPS